MSTLPTLGAAPASILRGHLKHYWLENEVLNKTAEKVVTLRHRMGWPELSRFPDDAKDALALAEQVELGFSPAHLVDECAPLACLSDEERKTIHDAVHRAYLERFDAPRVALSLRNAAKRMATALDRILEEWRKSDDALSDATLQARWRAVLEAAESLRDALDALPKGVVLP